MMIETMNKTQWLALATFGTPGQKKFAEDFLRNGIGDSWAFENSKTGFFAELVAEEFLNDARPNNWGFDVDNCFVYQMRSEEEREADAESPLKGNPDGWYNSKTLFHLTFEVKSGKPWAIGQDETHVWFSKTHNADRVIWVRDNCIRVLKRVSDKWPEDDKEDPALYEVILLEPAREYRNRATEKLRRIANAN